ncbi:unnamed protein product [Thelazia callipaeda]|uniref:IMV membrane protein n=1 Tax=Thelazia callipaeda TaxID=103827 RepID=A0A0N5CJZ0_THECL|nr:unnamed protein product [Thelazia callipaeda]
MADLSASDILNFILIGVGIGTMISMLIIVHMCKAIRSHDYADVVLNYYPIGISKDTTLLTATDASDSDISKDKQKVGGFTSGN